MPPVIVMGVCGSGKSTVGAVLAQRLHAAFLEGDAFHPPANVARMAAGVALTDDDRRDWLRALSDELGAAARAGRAVVLSCSALKRSYRDTLRAQASDLALVYLRGTPQLLAQRMAGRQGHYMPPSLLDSQLAALEPLQDDEAGIVLDIRKDPRELVREIIVTANKFDAPASG